MSKQTIPITAVNTGDGVQVKTDSWLRGGIGILAIPALNAGTHRIEYSFDDKSTWVGETVDMDGGTWPTTSIIARIVRVGPLVPDMWIRFTSSVAQTAAVTLIVLPR